MNDNVKGMRRQPTVWKKIFEKGTSNKEWLFKNIKHP